MKFLKKSGEITKYAGLQNAGCDLQKYLQNIFCKFFELFAKIILVSFLTGHEQSPLGAISWVPQTSHHF